MSRTHRRKSGDRPWLKAEPEFETVIYQVKRMVWVINFNEYYRNCHLLPKHRPEKVFELRCCNYYARVPVSLKQVDLKKKARIERDKGYGWNGTHHLKWYLKRNRRSKQKQQLHKIMRGEQDYYDSTFEETCEKALVMSWW